MIFLSFTYTCSYISLCLMMERDLRIWSASRDPFVHVVLLCVMCSDFCIQCWEWISRESQSGFRRILTERSSSWRYLTHLIFIDGSEITGWGMTVGWWNDCGSAFRQDFSWTGGRNITIARWGMQTKHFYMCIIYNSISLENNRFMRWW